MKMIYSCLAETFKVKIIKVDNGQIKSFNLFFLTVSLTRA